ncbi:MAG: SMC-Scp complex subunit ScpB [Vampirovibrionales bacterium]|nr:SMC-Scp complex subunit ScpB [Vampirovibrionales bacterium]
MEPDDQSADVLNVTDAAPPLKGRIEAALFITNHPLQIPELAELADASCDDVEIALMELISDYAFREGCALEVDDADGYILQARDEYRPVIDKMMPMELSQGALRTLSAIAIKGPLLQSELVAFRGAAVYDHIPELLAKKLVTKRREGRSYRLKASPGFYEHFRLTGDKKELAALMSLMGVDQLQEGGARQQDLLEPDLAMEP